VGAHAILKWSYTLSYDSNRLVEAHIGGFVLLLDTTRAFSNSKGNTNKNKNTRMIRYILSNKELS
jgi:hypothetical protein